MLFTNFIDHAFSVIESLDDMKTIQNQGGVGAMILDGPYICFTHVATCPFYFIFLIFTEHFIKKYIDRFTALALADPNNARSVKIVDDGSVFMAFAVADFVNADTLKASDSVSIAYTGDTTMKQIGKG